jgi:hypothetical protein
MHAQTPPATDADDLRRRVTNEVYQRLAFASFAIWTGGCLILFILFAAPSPRPIFPAMMSMMAPLLPAALVWLAYRPLIQMRTARALQAGAAGHS